MGMQLSSDTAQVPTSPAPVAGDYPYGVAGKVAVWDAHAWTGETADNASVPAPEKWHHAFLPFLRHQWFWCMAVSSVFILVLGYVASASGIVAIGLLTWPSF